MAELKAVARQAPEASGVYLMRDADGDLIYVGKAKVLRNRLSSYFTGQKDIKTRALVAKVARIEYIVTADEYEALLLENTLIKQHCPRYNINLKDGKSYPMIKLTNEEFPRIFRTRRHLNDGARYFGPFPGAQIVDNYLKLIDDLFPLRRCPRLRRRSSPCLYYHLGRCSAPCAGKISQAEYQAIVEQAAGLLSGDGSGFCAELERRMAQAASERRYEEAAKLRDAMAAIRAFKPENQVFDFDPNDRDYIAWASEGPQISLMVFMMRGGKMAGRDLFQSRSASEEDESLAEFLMSYYGPGNLPPPSIYLMERRDLSLVKRYLKKELGVNAEFPRPDEERHRAIMAMAKHNAQEDIQRRLREGGNAEAVGALQRELGLRSRPERIEGFDIAHLHGAFTVASLISFVNGVPDKANYRHFKIKSLKGKIDDFASMREALSRRYLRQLNEGRELPDLIVVDGGPGQVSAAKAVLDLLELDIELIGLAKREEELFFPGRSQSLILPRHSLALRLLQRVRDETHRFATGLNQRLRRDALSFKRLEAIEGIGPERAKRVMQAYGSLESLLGHGALEVAEKSGIPEALAERLLRSLAPGAEGPAAPEEGEPG